MPQRTGFQSWVIQFRRDEDVCQPCAAANGGSALLWESTRLVAAVAIGALAARPRDAHFAKSSVRGDGPQGCRVRRSGGGSPDAPPISRLGRGRMRTDEMDNWRDCGWSVGCRRASSELEVVVSQIQDGQWMLQVSPRRTPGLIGSLFGGKPSASPRDVHELAVAVHWALSTLGYLGSPHWRWDGFPDEKHSTSEPQAP